MVAALQMSVAKNPDYIVVGAFRGVVGATD